MNAIVKLDHAASEVTKSHAHPSAEHMQVRKNLSFIDESTPRYWFANDPFKTRVADSLQLVFPDGERYFIESVRAYRDDIKDEKLKAAVKDFIMQEAQHGIAHDKVNQRLRRQGMPIDGMIDFAKKSMARMTQKYSREFNIANTAATEHLTALMAQCFFQHKETLEEVDPFMRGLLAWHAIEEMEHRAVCFDVMLDAGNIDERTRKIAMIQTSFFLPFFTLIRANMMLKADGFSRLQRLKMFRDGLPWLFASDGILATVKKEYLDWYKEDFHPDNYPMIHSYPVWLKVYTETGDPIAAGQALWEAGYA